MSRDAVTPILESAAPRWVRRAQGFVVVSVAVVAFVGSYTHMQNLAADAGEGWRAWLLPISVDGMVISASLTMFVRRRTGQRGGLLAWVTLLVGLGASLAANIASAQPTAKAQALAAVYPIALLAVSELAMQQIKTGERQLPGSSRPEPDREQTLQARIDRAKQDPGPLVARSPEPSPLAALNEPRQPVSDDDLLAQVAQIAAEIGRAPGSPIIKDRLRVGSKRAVDLARAYKATTNGADT